MPGRGIVGGALVASAVVGAALAAGVALPLGCSPQRASEPGRETRREERPRDERRAVGAGAGRLSLGRAMAPGSDEGFARATEPRDLRFPADHGPHPAFRTEWWYLTGHLVEEGGGGPFDDPFDSRSRRRFGYQLTFFRTALRPPPPSTQEKGPATEETGASAGEAGPSTAEGGGSAWRSDQVFMAHFALTDVQAQRFSSFERFSRGALGLAGARSTPFRAWLEDWEIRATSEGTLFPLRLAAAEGDAAVELTLEAGRPITLQGDRGLSRKGPTPGHASYYYSLTRLPTRGRLSADGRHFTVRGSSWMDREWGTSALGPAVVGWDWFALELSDGRDVMLYRLRRADGSVTPESEGSVVEPGGERRRLAAAEVDLAAMGMWVSPATGSVYPSGWRLSSPRAGLDLRLEPLVRDQEHAGTIAYWEGAVAVRGTSHGESVSGLGYVELTGYDPRPEDGGLRGDGSAR